MLIECGCKRVATIIEGWPRSDLLNLTTIRRAGNKERKRGKIRETGTSALVHTRWERWSLNPVSRKMCLICGELSCVLLVREGGMVKTNVLFLRLAFALIFPHQPATISQLTNTGMQCFYLFAFCIDYGVYWTELMMHLLTRKPLRQCLLQYCHYC